MLSRKCFIGAPIAVLALWLVACSGGGGGDGSSESAQGTINGLSASQQSFVAARGYPDMFTLGFVTETLDENGQAVALSSPRRIESWIYNDANLTSALFDNGFFVSETNWGSGDPDLRPTRFNPTQFLSGMNRDQVMAILGQPSCEQQGSIAGKQLHVMRYRPTTTEPVVVAVLENGGLASITAGYAVLPAGVTDICS